MTDQKSISGSNLPCRKKRTFDFVHADIKGEVCLWLSVNRMYHISIQMYTVESDLTKQAEYHVLIIITVIFS